MKILRSYKQKGTIRPCGLTRRELRNLRALSGRRRPHIVRSWLVDETRLARYAEPGDRTWRLARAYPEAIVRCKARPARTHSRNQMPGGGVCSLSRREYIFLEHAERTRNLPVAAF